MIPEKQKILIVDDSEMNRAILTGILDNDYDFLEAENGLQALDVLRAHRDISLVLLDIVMPELDGFGVLSAMNEQHWIDQTPVIMISAESDSMLVERAYQLGATDYISRPFDKSVVRRRVINTLMLYGKQKHLMRMITEQVYRREKSNRLMTGILSHIVEFRNAESGLHVQHIQTVSELLLRQLARKTDRYALTEDDIALISTASALHDIGKISIPDSILNKPGKLTAEEFEVVKTHAAVGASILQNLPMTQDEPLIQVAYQICRWHHERYDGHGYPDGLVGDQIPITAQVVSLADVYDALTGERCYKKAYPHETAVRMIQNGECGVFNPLLIECLLDIQDQLQREIGTPPEARNFSLAICPLKTTCNTASPTSAKSRRSSPRLRAVSNSITISGRTRPPSAIISPTPSAKTGRSRRMRCFASTPSRPRTAAACGTRPSRPRPNRPTLPSRRQSPCAAKRRSAESPFERCGRASRSAR